MTAKNPKVSVSIVSYNSQKYLVSCLRHLIEQSYPTIEIILIDNASQQDPAIQIKKQLPDLNFKYQRNRKNLGYTGSHNIGIAKATGEYILCLNPDVFLDKDYIKNTVALMEKNKHIGAIQGKIFKCRFDGQLEKTNEIDSLGTKILLSHQYVELGGGETAAKYQTATEIFGVSGAAPMFRRAALEEIKSGQQYFDESFHTYKEDIDISWRLRHANWQCWLMPQAIAWHDRWETGSTENDRHEEVVQRRRQKSSHINFYSYRNHFLVNLKNEFWFNLIIYVPYIAWYEIKKFFYLFLFERSTLRGLGAALKLLPLTLRQRRDILRGSKMKPSDIRRWF
ncbi:MAG: glycosyltransferase family 2 protein [Parcubacteria group bacterium]|nr:glycosyltransferase family 2 protein [Parcubacteria group bacterium]